MALSASAVVRTEAQIDSCVNALLARMTLEEKVGQLNQLSGYGTAPEMLANIGAGNVGSILNETDPKVVNTLQRKAVEETRLGIPLIFARDVIHGFRTIFPIPLGQAASWDRALVEQGARIAADEASSVGIRWTFSPMLDVARDPRWGRMAEGFGEDTYLTSELGMAMVRGYQSDDLSAPNTMAACAKHFAGYGASESGRDYNTTWIPEVQLRDTYLPPFKSAADAGAATFMCSFNDINGVPSSGNVHLLQDILRDEWGYDGLMVSDWGSIQQMIPHGYSRDLRHAALQAVQAGVDVDMESYAYISHLKDLVQSGEVPVERLDQLVANMLRLKYRLGLFDNPYVDENKASRFYAGSSLEAAQRAVERSAVLLDNDGILPLDKKKVKKIAVIGPMADAPYDQAGTWSFDLEKDHSVTPLKALRDMYGAGNIIYAPGLEYSRQRDTKGFDEALEAASKADVVLYFAGEEAVLSGEAHCRTDLTLPGAQQALLDRLTESGKPVVTIIQAGRPLAIGHEVASSNATVYCFHGGTMTGPGLASLLSGKSNFSGHLPVSFPRTSGQVPIYYNRKNTGRPAEGMTLIDDIPLEAGQTSTGCTSFYLDAGDGPLFPFGYGLSYTDFAYSLPRISTTELLPGGTMTVSCDVTNTGKCAGEDVVQLYVRDHVGSLIRPVRELKGFEKIALEPGKTKTVTFTLSYDDLSFHGADLKPVTEPGEFSLWISSDSASGTAVPFSVVEVHEQTAAK